MRKIAPFLLLIVGVAAMLGAFMFWAANALPYQDATLELLAHQADQAKKWTGMFLLGLLGSLSAGIWLWLRRRARTTRL
jgi:hypothetical protein